MKPMASNSIADHCREIARRFLLTAVVVDDELSVSANPQVHGGLTKPSRISAKHTEASEGAQSPPLRPLNVDPITWSFARQGMVCGVVSPPEGENNQVALAKAAARADIVILDWRLSRMSKEENALPLLKQILMEDQVNRLRLIAIYTNQPDHGKIRKEIIDGLTDPERPD